MADCTEHIQENGVLQGKLRDLTAHTEGLEKFIAQVTSPPMDIVRIISASEGTAIVQMGSDLKELIVSPELIEPLNPGQKVRVKHGMTLQGPMQFVADTFKDQGLEHGSIATVKACMGNNIYEVDARGEAHLCYSINELEIGKEVCVDSSMMFVNHPIDKAVDRGNKVKNLKATSWDEIGGLEDAKDALREIIELPYLYKDLYAKFNKRPPKGVLLYGPPGCGKTLLARAAATALSKGIDTGFIYVKGPEILAPLVGVAEATIRRLFSDAREHYEEHKSPAIIFVDEADAILYKRGTGKSSDVERTIVPQFLSEMDGMSDSGAVLLLATNRPDTLDPAIIREGRIDRKVLVSRPNEETARDIFSIHLRNVPVSKLSREKIANEAAQSLLDPERVLYNIKTKTGDNPVRFSLRHLVNGAMIATIVDHATTFAIKRSISNKKSPVGVMMEDIFTAIDQVERQSKESDHKDEIAEFVEPFRSEVKGYTKA